MQVSFGELELTGGSAREGAFDMRLGGVPLLQEATRLRATQREMFSRGNAANEISFTVMREHGSIEACQLYIAKHKQEMDLAGRNTLKMVFFGGMVLNLERAVQTRCEGDEIGVRSRFNYTFAGGALT